MVFVVQVLLVPVVLLPLSAIRIITNIIFVWVYVSVLFLARVFAMLVVSGRVIVTRTIPAIYVATGTVFDVLFVCVVSVVIVLAIMPCSFVIVVFVLLHVLVILVVRLYVLVLLTVLL